MTAGPNLAREAHERITRMILEGAIKPGDALQEAVLGEALGMSRTPAREAIKRIESEGLAVRDGRFLRVRRLAPAEIEEIFFLRLALEPVGAHAAVALPAAEIAAIEARVRALMAGDPGDDGAHRQVDDDFHALIARASGNRAIAGVVADLRGRTCAFDRNQLPDRFLKGCEEHLAILDAIRAGDGNAAGRAMARHIECARDAILGRLAAIEAANGAAR